MKNKREGSICGLCYGVIDTLSEFHIDLPKDRAFNRAIKVLQPYYYSSNL